MWLGNAVTSSTLHADPPSNETIDVFYINKLINEKLICAFLWSVLPSIMKMHGPKNKPKKTAS